MDFFPLFARLDDQACLVVGGGEVATRKVRLLVRAGARVTVNAPTLSPELDEAAREDRIQWHAEPFDARLVDFAVLVIAATDDERVNRLVASVARERGRLVNIVDDGAHSSFITPAIVDRSPLVIAISTGGTMPVLARWMRQWLETRLPSGLGRLAAAAGRLRTRVQERLGALTRRRQFWEQVLEGPALDRIAAGADADRALEQELEQFDGGDQPGRVYLVGAGPGDPDLLTLRAIQLMQKADVVLYDRLVGQDILERVRRDAERIDVGKKAGCHTRTQEQINQLMIEHARCGRRVLRLKGGDPFIFGRGGEELQALKAAGVEFEVVPGVTAAAACGAYAGIPLTHRDLAHQVVFATGHCQKNLDCLDWHALAQPGQTRVFYMPVRNLGALSRQLIRNGLDGATPAALVENGTRADQRVVTARLDSLEMAAKRQAIRSPALLIVGETVALHQELSWFRTADPEPESETPALAVAGWAY